jgi:hypothetical protein
VGRDGVGAAATRRAADAGVILVGAEFLAGTRPCPSLEGGEKDKC